MGLMSILHPGDVDGYAHKFDSLKSLDNPPMLTRFDWSNELSLNPNFEEMKIFVDVVKDHRAPDSESKWLGGCLSQILRACSGMKRSKDKEKALERAYVWFEQRKGSCGLSKENINDGMDVREKERAERRERYSNWQRKQKISTRPQSAT